METAAFCEFDDKARQVLRKNWPATPIFEDVRTLNKEMLDEQGVKDIRLICGGYPCQPFSLAGKRGGSEDDRHLWPEMFRLIQELRPSWVVGENVFGHISMGLDQVLADLEAADYSARSFVIPACACDAPHRRDRVWTVAHSNSEGESNGPVNEQRLVEDALCIGGRDRGFAARRNKTYQRPQDTDETFRSSKDVADANSAQCEGKSSSIRVRTEYSDPCSTSRWQPEPSVGRVADGVPNRSHRLKQLGNAVVPQVVQAIGEMIIQVEREQAA